MGLQLIFRIRCKICDHIKNDFHLKEYTEGFNMMKKLVKDRDVTFFAGSCPLDELDKHLETEDLYTIEHYFKCKCGRYFYTGYCVRGRPVLKVINKMPKNFVTTISGHYGKYFEENTELR